MKNMEKKSIADYASNSLRWFGVELILLAWLIYAFNPKVTLLLVPFTGSKVTLSLVLLLAGIESTVVGVLWRRRLQKINNNGN